MIAFFLDDAKVGIYSFAALSLRNLSNTGINTNKYKSNSG